MRFLICLIFLATASVVQARSTQDYLPGDARLDPVIPTPESVLGWEVGDWHVSHDKLVQYLQVLSAASPRISLKIIGHSYEQRPLLQLAISSAVNQGELDQLRRKHLDGDGPLVVQLGYSVHGNEASGSNAALLVAYYLAASQSAFVRELLEGSIVIIDPSLNPDGLNRFASWANSNAAAVPVSAAQTRQHEEGWPSGRTNHYWFDLNRDWLPLINPESRARIVEFHHWLPHVLTDHHEQGGYPGYFFQPGVPSRQNPLTPDENFEITRALAQYHSAALGRVGQSHFTEDAYDDFYYGKGSTYPDINGSVGILFEQRAIRGQVLETSNGIETFRQAISNQFETSLSTLRGSWEMRERLKAYQAGFHDEMATRAGSRRFKAWVIGDDGDPARAAAFLETLRMHRIQYQALAENLRVGSIEFRPGQAWVIPAAQRQFGLAEALMEQRTTFADSTFYDVSAWTLPLAYNLPYAMVGKLPRTGDPDQSSAGLVPNRDATAWVIPWNQLDAPILLQELLHAGARVRVATKGFSAHTGSGLQAFAAGTLLLQARPQESGVLDASLDRVIRAALAGLRVYDLSSGLTLSGPDLGSKHFKIIRPVKPLLLGGKGISAYDVGEQWHLLDQRLGLAIPIVDIKNLGKVQLAEFTHLLMADGDYSSLNGNQHETISRWVQDGGILVSVNRAASWAEGLCFENRVLTCEPEFPGEEIRAEVSPRAYGDFADDKAQQLIGGAIVRAVLDLTHPLAFGYQRPDLPLFRRGSTLLEASQNAYSSPIHYAQDPLMAGFIGDQKLELMRGQAALIAERRGRGLVVRFANSPLFRAFWRGTERLFVNALYFGQVIETTELPEVSQQPKPEAPRQH